MKNRITAIVAIMRPYQWVKNTFVLAPLLFSGHLLEIDKLLLALTAFMVFCVVSSAVYVFNDLFDIESDRQHATKKRRPLPSGRISVRNARLLFMALIVGSLLLIILIQPNLKFLVVLIAYVLVNIAYSLGMKQIAILEIAMVSVGFILRLFAGAIIIEVALTSWIVVATGLLATIITMGKRRGDLAQQYNQRPRPRPFKSYTIQFLDHVMASLGGVTIVTYLLYCMSDYAIARFGPYVIWTVVPVIIGIIRFQQIIIVDNQGGDPTRLAYQDNMLRSTLAAWVLLFIGLIYVVGN